MDRRARTDERIKTLLTSTDLTFKQIIEKLKDENMSASFNTIRRVNRNHRYRKPRYDAKLTPQQRKELVIILKNTEKPNLSSLARQFGVCHGSIWYWWDKLTKLKEKNEGRLPEIDPSLDFVDDYMENQQQNDEQFVSFGPNDSMNLGDPDSDPLDLDEPDEYYVEDASDFATDYSLKNYKNQHQQQQPPPSSHIQSLDELERVGAVQAKSIKGEYIQLPIIMYAPSSSSLKNLNIWNSSKKSAMSSSTNSTPTASTTDQTSSLSKRLAVN